jgi:hypothetical protein
MPDLRVIKGGGKGPGSQKPLDYNAEWAENHFIALIMEVLRALARGEDHSRRVLRSLNAFIEKASNTQVPAGDIIQAAISWAHNRALVSEEVLANHDTELIFLLRASLPVIAESIADDPAAKGRRSKRETALESAFETMMLGRETRSRSNDWSYTQHLVARLGPFKPPARSAHVRKRRPRKAKPISGMS